MKALVIGVDSASPFLIRKWIDKLPNLRNIFENGASGILQSIIPPESVPAWQCFATGKNPAKIGIFGFTYIGRDRNLRRGTTTPEIGCFWDHCSNRGMKVGVFNVPGTYPPYALNGFMVSGFPVPTRKTWAYPKDLMRRLDKAVGGYDIDVPLANPHNMRGGEEAYLRMAERLHTKSLEAAKCLIKWYQPHVFMMTFQGIDVVQHDFWRYMNDSGSQYSNVLRDWYVKMDSAIGELRQLTDDDAYTLALSDHGSTGVSTALYINEYLAQKGLLATRSKVGKKGEIYAKLRRTVLKRVPAELIAAFYKQAPSFISHRLTRSAEIERTLADLIENIVWEKTEAFSTGGHQAHIYLTANREPKSSSQTLMRIIDAVKELKDPKTGKKLRPLFHFRENLFRGSHEREAPDLCVELFTGNEKVQINPGLGSEEIWSFSPHFSSVHTREGFWGLAGPEIRKGVNQDASILDLAPTLLKLMKVKVQTDFDGKVLKSVFRGTAAPSVLALTGDRTTLT